MRLPLPIDAVLPDLVAALTGEGRAVLQAPPGAGKTTRVPLALLDAGSPGRIVMLEPRRLAARAAAERMAATLGEPVGQTVGYRMRGATRVSPATRIEVVTEGVLTRMLLGDPSLAGIGTVIFDEFHERSLNADLGLALAWEARGALRPDLRLLVMSATLDAGPVAALLGNAPVVTAEGRAHPVETLWLDRPTPRDRRFEDAAAELVRAAATGSAGGILVFLPGAAEIRRVADRLAGLPGCVLRPLYGALPPAAQRAAIAPSDGPRKIVLATSIAETSLTIEDVRIVVDAGLTRRQRFDPGSGMARLVTERVSRAEADQRRGRAGRVAAGRCYRLWTRGEEGALTTQPPPEIAVADLARLALDLAIWGDRDGTGLAFLTPPPAPALAAAQALLRDLGMLDAEGAPTAHGRTAAALPVHPRLAHMLLTAGTAAAPVAALLGAPPEPGAPVDFAERLRRPLDPATRAEARRLARGAPVAGADGSPGVGPGRTSRARVSGRPAPASHTGGGRAAPSTGDGMMGRRPEPGGATGGQAVTPGSRGAPSVGDDASPSGAEARAWNGAGEALSVGAMLALAYPDRVALRRPGEAPRYLTAGGKGVVLPADSGLAALRLLAVAETDGDPREARIRSAAALTEGEVRALFADRIETVALCAWSPREGRVTAVRHERLGALVLSERPWRDAPPEAVTAAMLDGVRELGLPWSDAARRLVARVGWARAAGADLPDMGEPALMAGLDGWLAPHLGGVRSAEAWRSFDLLPALGAMLDWPQRQALDATAPAAFETPLGRAVPIDYSGEGPAVAVRLQELFGLTRHPVVAGRPLRITLLSPAGRPVQVTSDLPGFWAASYADVRRDMRGRYPRHPWPEDPTVAAPTLRAKPRG